MGTADTDAYWKALRRERYKTVLDLRAQGVTYYDIGKQLGVSASYASALGKHARRDFYRQITSPLYVCSEPHPPRLTWMDSYTLYRMKDFLEEIANG
jgi:hypothetical protein